MEKDIIIQGPWSLLRSPFLHPDHPFAKRYFPPSQWFMKTSEDKKNESASEMCQVKRFIEWMSYNCIGLDPA